MDLAEIKLLLKSSESRNITKALIQIRSKEVKSLSGIQNLLDQNFIGLLVPLLERSNQKNIDISLSILANLLQSDSAQVQLRQCSGLDKLINIVDNIQDRNIVCRGWRAIANACQDKDNLSELRSTYNLCSIIGRAVSSTSITDTDTLTVLARCIRICCPADVLSQEPAISDTFITLIKDPETNESLLKAVCKCVAKLSHGCSALQAHSLLQVAENLVSHVKNAKKQDISDNCLGTLINLSQLDQFRPGLGAAGVVELLVHMFRSQPGQSSVPQSSIIRTLCLFCRESVNRVRMREGGGCGVLVSILASGDKQPRELRDTVLRSLLQFLYDNHSLNVLLSEGLVPCLVKLIEEHMVETKMKHKCFSDPDEVALENENSDKEEEAEKDGCDKELADKTTGDKNDEADRKEICDKKKKENENQELQLSEDDTDNELDTVANENEIQDSKAETQDAEVAKAKVNSCTKSRIQESISTSTTTTSSSTPTSTKPTPVFRITSPSYQAVQYELQQFMQLRSSFEQQQQQKGNLSPFWASSPGSPKSPCSVFPEPESPSSSLCQSPDRSPPSINCSYSPVSSPESHVYSPTMSPLRYSPLLYSPSDDRSQPSPEPTYSPVENFSDEEDEETPSTVKETRSKEDKSSTKQGGNSSNVTAFCDQSTTSDKDNSSQQQNVKSEKSATAESKPETPELIPWTKRTIRIQRTATYLGQTFVLPPVSDERPGFGEGQGPSKRPRLSGSAGSVPAYKYVSSLPMSPVKKSLSRQSSRSSVSDTVTDASSRIGWILQILSRLSQADRPHSDLTSINTLDTLVKFLSRIANDDVSSSKAAKILNRLSTNLHCLFPFFTSRHISRIMLNLEQLELKSDDDGCQFSQLRKLLVSVAENITLLAETGYGEGEICHRLVHPMIDKTDKQSIVISAALLVRQRKMLDNILLRHNTLDLLLDTLETRDNEGIVSDCVHSVSRLAGYLGVHVCCDMNVSNEVREVICRRHDTNDQDDFTLVCDDGNEIRCNKSIICSKSHVFAAMLTGSFNESDKTRVSLPHASSGALKCLVHFLYSCDPESCPEFVGLEAKILLELVSLSDQYLLTDLNLYACHTCIKHAGSIKYLNQIYRAALQSNYPVNCAGRSGSLSNSVVNYLLVGHMDNMTRSQLFASIITSDLGQHLLDDISKLIRAKLDITSIQK